jgi:hypothetical protein
MYPGLSELDCRVAEFRYQQMLVEGRYQQFVAGARAATAGTRSVSMSLRQQVGAFLVRAGQRLQGVQAATRESLGSIPASEWVPIA